MKNPLILATLCGVVWGLWPVLARYSKVSPALITVFVVASTAIVSIGWIIYKGELNINTVGNSPANGILLVLLCGTINAIGMIAYGFLLSSSSGFDVSKYGTIATALIPFFMFIMSWLILKEPISTIKVLGMAMIIGGIYFLQKK